jgi:hypothetical protein
VQTAIDRVTPPLHGISVPYFFGHYGYDLAPNPLSGMGRGIWIPSRSINRFLKFANQDIERCAFGYVKVPKGYCWMMVLFPDFIRFWSSRWLLSRKLRV